MDLTQHALAAYDGRMSEQPAYDSSPAGMAFSAGLWARAKGILPEEVRAGRGYKMILNRDWVLDFKNTGAPVVTRKS